MPSIMSKVPKSAISQGPLWKGPEAEGPLGGVTQSMIAAWLGCRERFRVKYLLGWRAEDQFNKYLEYGQCWHVCEEHLAAEKNPSQVDPSWKFHLRGYCLELSKKYPLNAEDIDHWRRVCETQFPIYVDYWKKHKDVEQRTPLMQEQVFDVPYELPSGRTIRLRGKFDSVDLIGKGKSAGVYLQENKTKGDVDRQALEKQLNFDLQTMTYLIALSRILDSDDVPEHYNREKLLGVRYNVVRRPFSGGKGSIKRNPAKETKDQFYQRLADDYIKAEPEYWFTRFKCEVSPDDVRKFREQCLDPILEAMCWWYDCQAFGYPTSQYAYPAPDFHWRHPFGVVNSTDEGYASDVDGFIDTGSTVGLRKATTLFGEL